MIPLRDGDQLALLEPGQLDAGAAAVREHVVLVRGDAEPLVPEQDVVTESLVLLLEALEVCRVAGDYVPVWGERKKKIYM